MQSTFTFKDSSGDTYVYIRGELVMKKRADRSRGPTLLFQVAPSQTVELPTDDGER